MASMRVEGLKVVWSMEAGLKEGVAGSGRGRKWVGGVVVGSVGSVMLGWPMASIGVGSKGGVA